MTKTCGTCKQIKPLDEFGTRRNSRGVTYPRTSCRACTNTAERENPDRRSKATARQREARAELRVSGEITALIRATTSRRTTPPPRVTAEELAAWHQAGCPIAPHQRRKAAA